jgi:hypothetical protein
VQVTGPTPHASWRLLAVSPDMAEFLAVRPVLALYASTLIAIWQRLVSFIISWDFVVLGKVMRKRGRFTVDVPSAGDQREVDICLTLITLKAR